MSHREDSKPEEASAASADEPQAAVSKIPEDLEALGHDARKLAEDEGEALKQGFVAGVDESRAEFRDDMREAKEFNERQVERAKDAARDVRHPHLIVDAAEEKLRKTEAKLDHVVKTVEHPSVLVEDARQKVKAVGDDVAEVYDHATSGVEAPIDKKKLPLSMKVFGALCILGVLVTGVPIFDAVTDTVRLFTEGKLDDYGLSSIVVTFVALAVVVLMALMFLLLGIRLLRNRRRFAAMTIDTLFVLMVAAILCSIMLQGIGTRLIVYGVILVLLVALQSYVDPSLSEERELRRKLRDMEIRDEAESGKLGLDPSGKGYITLNFFNLFWIFVVCSILGLAIETIYHFLVVDPGQYQDRAGLLFGPFSPIYGCGAVLMTIFLNRFHKSNVILVFFVSAVIGGAFEYFTSYFMQYAFGAVAWDYTGMWLSIGGRTCGVFMIMWGILGVVWIKLLLPIMLRVVNLIPWNWRYTITAIAAALMLTDAIMTLQALDCWYERLSDDPVTTPIQQFYDRNFDNTYMADRFQSMTIHPDDAVRAGSTSA